MKSALSELPAIVSQYWVEFISFPLQSAEKQGLPEHYFPYFKVCLKQVTRIAF